MSLPEPIREALGEGLRLEAEGGRLRARGPKRVVSRVLPLLKAHKPEILRDLERIEHQLARAVEGLPITPGELRAELAPEDLEDMAAGRTTPGELRTFARIIANRRPSEAPREPWSEEELAEAREERAAIMEHEGGMPRVEADRVAELFETFYSHLMGPGVEQNCCYAPANRYCPEGRRLRDAYYGAAAGRFN